MSDDPEKKRRHLKANAPKNYEVGYGKPPIEHQFQKGQSGNPRGRPKGAQKPNTLGDERLKDIILTEAYRTIKLVENGKQVTMTMVEAVVRSMAVNAAKGQLRAQKLFTQLLTDTERANKRVADAWIQEAINYKVNWTEEIERCKRLRLPIPSPIPHPDHIEIDMKTGEVRINGPFTKEEKARWDMLERRRQEAIQAITSLQSLLDDPENEEIRHMIEDDLTFEVELFEKINKVLL